MLVVAAFAALLVTAGPSTAARDGGHARLAIETLGFTTVQLDGFGPVLTSHFGTANVVIVLSISGAINAGPFNYASETWAQRFDWNRRFVISAAVAEPTTGYRLTIRRITIQRIRGSHRQFCVIGSVATPESGASVLQRRSWALHAVALSRRPFRTRFRYTWTIPRSAVLRRADGKLLAMGHTSEFGKPVYPAAPALCRA